MDTLKQLKTGRRQRLPNPLAAKTGRGLRPRQRAPAGYRSLPHHTAYQSRPGAGNRLLTMNLRGEVVEGNHPAPFEAWLHTAIMKAKPRVNAITRIHARMANIFSVTDRKLEPVHNHGSFFAGGVPVFTNTGSDIDGQTRRRSGAGPRRQAGYSSARQRSSNGRQNDPRSGHDGDLPGGSGGDASRRAANRHTDSSGTR